MSILLAISTFVLILTSIFLILLVLAQKAKSDGGMGAAMGGGMAEATFGADTGNVLSKATINAAIVFFVLSFALYLGRIYERKHAAAASGSSLPSISVPAAPAQKAPAGVVVPASTAPTPGPTAKP
ncbi:MAG TPA: preprotein translocase subunit SecG [Opitutaceae bacterium]|jgi:preprotein translocase subunit SecG